MWSQDGSLYAIAQTLHFRGNSRFIFCKRIQDLKRGLLKERNNNSFGKVDQLLNDSLTRIGVPKTKEGDGSVTVEDRTRRERKKNSYKWNFTVRVTNAFPDSMLSETENIVWRFPEQLIVQQIKSYVQTMT